MGFLAGSWLGVHIAIRITERILGRAVAALLVGLSGILIGHDQLVAGETLAVSGPARLCLGVLAGLVLGAVSSLLGSRAGNSLSPPWSRFSALPRQCKVLLGSFFSHQQIAHHLAVDVGEAKVAARVAVGQLFVVDA